MAAVKTNINLEFQGATFDVKELEKKAMDEAKKGNKNIKKLNLYIKPQDNKVYYTVNDDISGNVDMN